MRGKLLPWIGMVLAAFLTLSGQLGGAQQRRPGRQQSAASDEPTPVPERTLSRKMLKASYEQLQKDVQHLSELANELKDEVDKTDEEDVLSLSGVKKAEEIEKLAKKIQGRMKNL